MVGHDEIGRHGCLLVSRSPCARLRRYAARPASVRGYRRPGRPTPVSARTRRSDAARARRDRQLMIEAEPACPERPVDLVVEPAALRLLVEPLEVARIDPGDLADRPADVPAEVEDGALRVAGRRPGAALAVRAPSPGRRRRPGRLGGAHSTDARTAGAARSSRWRGDRGGWSTRRSGPSSRGSRR